jgi:phage repressor protein C with HTH and peptisase S24 domain
MRSQPFLPKPKKPKLLVVRRVVGKSMTPTLQPGQIVIGVRPRTLRIGQIVVVQHENTEKIKRITKLGPDRVFLSGDNPYYSTDSRDFGWLPREYVIAAILWRS